MFDSALNRGNVAGSRLGRGATFSMVVHAALIGMAFFIGDRPTNPKKNDPKVTFVQAMPLTPATNAPSPSSPPPPPSKRRASSPKVEKVETETIKEPDTIVEGTGKTVAQPVNDAQGTPNGGGTDDSSGTKEDGPEDGPPGAPNGQVGGTGAIPQNVVIPFGAGMNRPVMIAGRDPIYTKEALAARVEGLMIVRCTIDVTGATTSCRVIKELQHMRQAVLDALYSRRYTPVLFNGQPVNVDYVFNIKLVLPTR